MKIGLFNPLKDHEVCERIAEEFLEKGISVEVMQQCLCSGYKRNGLDAIIFHPEYSNDLGCWDRIKSILEVNPESLFYLLAIETVERKEFFGEKSNLVYIGDVKDAAQLLVNPVEYMQKHKLQRV